MKKHIYIVLTLITVGLIVYVVYYAYSQKDVSPSTAVATSTQEVITTPEPVKAPDNEKLFTTKTGKTIKVIETNPAEKNLSTIAITPEGFATNTPLLLEKNKLTQSFFADINKDTYEELIMITTTEDAQQYGEATIYTTTHDLGLIPVTVPTITEADTKKGKLFEGYTGHDSFTVIGGVLVREFPLSTTTSATTTQNKVTRSIAYTLVEKNGLYSVLFSKYTPAPTSTIQVTSSTSSSISIQGSSWIWQSATASGTPFNAPKGDKFVLTFDKGDTVQSTTDCNTLGGTYITSKDTLRFSSFMSTLMACDGSQESVYSSLLAKVDFYKIENETLTFILSNKEIMTFKLKK